MCVVLCCVVLSWLAFDTQANGARLSSARRGRVGKSKPFSKSRCATNGTTAKRFRMSPSPSRCFKAFAGKPCQIGGNGWTRKKNSHLLHLSSPSRSKRGVDRNQKATPGYCSRIGADECRLLSCFNSPPSFLRT